MRRSADGTSEVNPSTLAEQAQHQRPAIGNGAAAPDDEAIFDDVEALREANKDAFAGETEAPSGIVSGRPKKELYVRFHPDDGFYLPAHVWSPTSDDSKQKPYYILQHLWSLEDLQGGLRAVVLATWMGVDGSLGLWDVPASSGAGDWALSGQQILAAGRRSWLRIQADSKEKYYRHFLPQNPIPDRPWPEMTFSEILRKAFKGRVVTSEDHELIRRLRNA
jgi:hypothetical protein